MRRHGIGAMLLLLYRLFIRIFDHSPCIQPCRVFSAAPQCSLSFSAFPSLSFALLCVGLCCMLLYMWASGAHQTHCLTVHRHRVHFIRYVRVWMCSSRVGWYVCVLGKINTMTKLLCICCVKHETFSSDGTEYDT